MTPSSGNTWAAFSNGLGAFRPSRGVWLLRQCSWTFGIGDFNGDGKADLWCRDPASGNTQVARSGPAGRADVLTQVTNELGGVTQVSYAPASSWPVGTVEPGLQQPPKLAQTVSQLKIGDGRGLSMTTTYAYSAGRWDPRERRFLGFENVTATDSSGATTATTFRVLPGYSANRESQVDRSSAAGVLLARTTKSYNESASGGCVHVSLSSQTLAHCQGASVCQTTRTDYLSYDIYGNAW